MIIQYEYPHRFQMKAEIERCYNAYKPKIDDLDLAATIFRTFGKGLIKKGKLSPDGFVQMAIQLANFKVLFCFEQTNIYSMHKISRESL